MNRRSSKIIGLVLLTFVLAGCFPHIKAYYLPESHEGRLDEHSKYSSSSPDWMLERGGARFKFSAIKKSDGETEFFLGIYPLRAPGDTGFWAKTRDEAWASVKPITIGFEKKENQVVIISNSFTEKIDITHIAKGTGGTRDHHIVELNYEKNLRLIVHQYVHLRVALKNKDVNSYSVQWPAVIINSHRVELPPIQFVWTRGLQVQTLN